MIFNDVYIKDDSIVKMSFDIDKAIIKRIENNEAIETTIKCLLHQFNDAILKLESSMRK